MRGTQYELGNVALWVFVGAGTLGAGTLIYGLVASRRTQAAALSALRVTPVVTPLGGAAMISGTF